MPVSTRLSAPNYKIFEPDALDQIYARGNLDPIMGGISYAFGNAHKVDNEIAQEKSLVEQDKFNKMARDLDRYEIAQKSEEARMKLVPQLIGHNVDANDIIGSDLVLRSDSGAPALGRAKVQSEINKNNASASADRSAGQDQVTQTWTDPTTQSTYTTTRKGKGVNAPALPQPNRVDMTTSTPQPQVADPATAQIQTKQRAGAAVGGTAQLLQTAPSGHTLWVNPANGKRAVFDQTGKQVRAPGIDN